ncbi:MAG TPA: VOC family protein [Pseudonocardiaceae bacterium]|jgi:catechol 2,3-dioxygenase-like lactoylglutathione lyase family enzyme
MVAPVLRGLHHLKLPVSDLDASLAWYQRVLGALHQRQFDHIDSDGVRYAVILAVPGVDTPLELRWAPEMAARTVGYDPISFAVDDPAALDAWAAHLDELGVEHSPVALGAAGRLLAFADPDGTHLRVLELPKGGVQHIVMGNADPEPTNEWLFPAAMRHPRHVG